MQSKIEEFILVIDGIYGVYLDSTWGYNLLRKSLHDYQVNSTPQVGLSVAELDKVPFSYGKGDPRLPGSKQLHIVTQGRLKKRNEDEGANYQIIANLCVVLIYQYWEDYYRKEIAVEIGTEKNKLKSDIWGDLAILRHSIIHHRAIATKDIDRCRLLKWFIEGDTININKDMFEELIAMVKKYLIELGYEQSISTLDKTRPVRIP